MSRYREGRRGKSRKEQGLSVLLLLGGALILGVLGAGYWFLVRGKPQINEATLCPMQGPRSVRAILIDRSDPITPQQAQRVRQEFDRLRNTAVAERIDLYVAVGDAVNVLEPKLRLCNPGQGKDANELYQNPAFIQKRFDTQFWGAIEKTMDELLRASTQPASPILESIRAAAVDSFGSFEQGSIPLSLTIVSDMVQHTAANSHFRNEVDFDGLSRAPAWRQLQANLKGAEVHIFYLLRPEARLRDGKPVQNRRHQLFWERALTASNGRLMAIESF
jgi:hypothetical protein